MQIPREQIIHSLICCFTKQCSMCSYNTCDSNFCESQLLKDIELEMYKKYENNPSIDN